jgi:predicted helicase
MRPSVDKKSGIKNDPNEFSDDPKYVVELTKRVIRVCVETLDLIDQMPEANAGSTNPIAVEADI